MRKGLGVSGGQWSSDTSGWFKLRITKNPRYLPWILFEVRLGGLEEPA
jgi:hypothetical protein